MHYDARMSHGTVTALLVLFLSVVLVACGGGGGGSTGTNSQSNSNSGNTNTGVPTVNYTVTTLAGNGGRILPDTATFSAGTTLSFEIKPDNGNSIAGVSGCGGTLKDNIYTIAPLSADCTITARFLPGLNIRGTTIVEGDNGIASLRFSVTLSSPASGNVDVGYTTSDGSAEAGSDYTAVTNGILTIPAGSTSATLSIDIIGDTVIEADESFSVTLNTSSANATLGKTITATGNILDDDASSLNGFLLNDTGISRCADGSNFGLSCPQTDYPGQDAEYGRDALASSGKLVKQGGGRAGFDFSKLDASGIPLTNQSVDYVTSPWDCVRDNHTGLVWEVKTTDGNLRDASHTYSWYNSTGVDDGGDPGTANGGSCVDTSNCDTEKFVAAVNAAGLCSWNDWRLPSVDELMSLRDNSVSTLNTVKIDTDYFPNAPAAYFMTSSPAANDTNGIWAINFDSAGRFIWISQKNYTFRVRLVRGGR